jgi:anti-sigma regulatory factor (Ser/Thr protein kinase)
VYYYDKDDRGRVAMADLNMNAWARRAVLRSLAELRRLAEVLEDWMRVTGYSRKDIFAIRLVLEEATVNAFRHGNQGDPNKVVRVGYVVTPDEVVVEVEDQGPGFDPALVADPLTEENTTRVSGRGLYLMRVYTSGLSFSPQGNRVTLWRRRSA